MSFWGILLLLLLILGLWALYRRSQGLQWGEALWPIPAWRVFSNDPTVFAPFHHRGLTDLPDAGHPDDVILRWWQQQPQRWKEMTTGCSRYSCPSKGIICAAQEGVENNERATIDGTARPADYQAHPTACEVTNKTFYADENEFCRFAPAHPACRNGGRSTEGVLLEHPIGIINTGW